MTFNFIETFPISKWIARAAVGLVAFAWPLAGGAQDAPTSPLLTLSPSPRSELLDKVAAVAGRDLITLRDIEEDLRLTYLELGAEQPDRFPRPFFEKRRDDLIERRLLFRHSEEILRREIPEGVPTLTPEMSGEVQARVGQIIGLMRSHFEDEAAFRKELARWGFDEDTLYQRLMRREEQSLIISLGLGRQIQLPADEVNQYKAELKAANQSLQRYRLQHIVLKLPPNPPPHEHNRIHAKALEIGLQVRSGAMTFEEAARRYSEAPGGQAGGDLGFVESRDLADSIRQALIYVRPGDITLPIEMSDGYHLFKVLEIEDARDFLWDRKFRELRREVMEELRQTQRIERFDF